MKDKRMGFDIAYMETHKLGLDDTFQFRCRACGKCCKHRVDVLLTPYDLFRIARFFVRTPQDIVERYCKVIAGTDSHIPIVNIKAVPPDNACPFLRNRKCMVHQDKPLVCASFPLARMADQKETFYVLQPGVDCGGKDRTVSVRDWIGSVRNEESDTFAVRWFEVMGALTVPLLKKWDTLEAVRRDEIFSIWYHLLYMHYDIKKPFLPQFEDNASAALVYATTYGTIDVPEWTPISADIPKELQYALLLHKAYFLYRKDWCAERNVSVYEVDEEIGIHGGECYVCRSEFEDEEFQMADYMEEILLPEDFSQWKQLVEEE